MKPDRGEAKYLVRIDYMNAGAIRFARGIYKIKITIG